MLTVELIVGISMLILQFAMQLIMLATAQSLFVRLIMFVVEFVVNIAMFLVELIMARVMSTVIGIAIVAVPISRIAVARIPVAPAVARSD